MNQKQKEAGIFPRRKFIKGGAAGLGVGLVGLPIAQIAFGGGNDPLRLALIGCGGRGGGAALQALRADPNVKLVAMADVFKDRLESTLSELNKQEPKKVDVTAEHQFIGFDAYKRAIALADVIILTTPPGFRPIHFEEAVNQGKHVFMEKPVAVDAPGVRTVLAAAKKAKEKNLKVGVGFQRRHHAGYIETIKRLQSGAIGQITSMRAYWNTGSMWYKSRAEIEQQAGRPVKEMEYQLRNWYYFNWLCGDHIVEQHVHNLDVINWLKGTHPIRALGMGGRQVRIGPDFGEVFDHHYVDYEYPDGIGLSAQCRQIMGCWDGTAEQVTGTEGVSDISGNAIWTQSLWKFDPAHAKDPYQQEHDDLFKAIRNDSPYNEAEYGATSTMTAIMGRMASYSGNLIEWDKALNSNLDLSPKSYAMDAMAPVLPGKDGLYACALPGRSVAL